MEFCEIIFGSKLFKEAIELRQNILRDPLGLNLYDEGIDNEHGQLHFGLLENNTLVACLAITPLSDTHVKLTLSNCTLNRNIYHDRSTSPP